MRSHSSSGIRASLATLAPALGPWIAAVDFICNSNALRLQLVHFGADFFSLFLSCVFGGRVFCGCCPAGSYFTWLKFYASQTNRQTDRRRAVGQKGKADFGLRRTHRLSAQKYAACAELSWQNENKIKRKREKWRNL